MNPKEILKRIYYAIISGLFFLTILFFLIDEILYSGGMCSFYTIHPIRVTVFILLFALAFTWLLTIHNSKRERYIFMGIIFLTFLWALVNYGLLYHPQRDYYCGRNYYLLWQIVKQSTLYVSGAIVMIAGFFSNTRYDNILPKQSKTVSWIFRILSWIGQFISWAFVLLCITVFIYKYLRYGYLGL